MVYGVFAAMVHSSIVAPTLRGNKYNMKVYGFSRDVVIFTRLKLEYEST